MTPELHADDLLDREANGSLSLEERSRLEGHLAVCAVCRFEREVRADFKAEFEALGPTRKAPATLPERSAERTSTRPRARPLRVLGLVAAALLFASVAAAELSGAGLLSLVRSVAKAPAALQSGVPEPKHRGTKRAAAVASLEAGEPTPEAEAPSESLTASPPSPSAQGALLASDTVAKSRANELPTKASGPTLPNPVAGANQSAATSFAEAGAARELGDYTVAVDRYERLLLRFPNSAEALTTQVVLGRLLLDRGEPSAAIPHFDAYLATGASGLREEAFVGRALALGRLGQAVSEAEAWHALLRAYPRSLSAPRAQLRLSTLEAQ